MNFSKVHLKKWCLHLAGILAALIIAHPAAPSYAAPFCHKHSAVCYQENTYYCSSHRFHGVKEQAISDKCPQCNKTGKMVAVFYIYSCVSPKENASPVYDQQPFEGERRCNSCGYSYYTNNDIAVDRFTHSAVSRKLICDKKEGDVVGELTLSASTTAWTNQPVRLTASVRQDSKYFVLDSAPYNWGKGATSTNIFDVNANGTYTVSVTCKGGYTATEKITVANIDTTAPAVSLKSTSDAWSESGITVVVNATDSGSGLADKPYSYNGAAYVSDNSFLVTSNGTLNVSVKDKVGNVTSSSIKISKVGRDPAVIAAENKAKEEALAKAAAAEKKASEAEAAARNAQAAAESAQAAADKAAMEKAAAESSLAAEKAAREQSEREAAETLAAEKAAREQSEREAAETLAAEKAAREQSEREAAERLSAEATARQEAEAAEAKARQKIAELEAEKAEAARIEAERKKAEKLAAEAAQKLEEERTEAAKLEALRQAAYKLEVEQAAAAQAARISKLEKDISDTQKLIEQKQAEYDAERQAARISEAAKDARYEAEKKAAETLANEQKLRYEAQKQEAETRFLAEKNAAEAKYQAEKQAAEAKYQADKKETQYKYESEKRDAEARYAAEKKDAEAKFAAEKKDVETKYETRQKEVEQKAEERARKLTAEKSEAEKLAAELIAKLEAEKAATEAAAAEKIQQIEAQKKEVERMLTIDQKSSSKKDKDDTAEKDEDEEEGKTDLSKSKKQAGVIYVYRDKNGEYREFDPETDDPEILKEKEPASAIADAGSEKLNMDNASTDAQGSIGNDPADTKTDASADDPGITMISDKTVTDTAEVKQMNAGGRSLYIGILLLLLGTLALSSFNYVYVSVNGRIRPIALAKAKKDKSKIVLKLPKGALPETGKYLVHVSPWIKRGAGKLPVYVEMDGEIQPLAVDAGNSFSY